MGNLLARFRHRDVRIILLGLDSAGKTTILYRLKLDEMVTTVPTIGFNVESIQYKDLRMTAWDIGSRDKIRPLFRHYYKGADAVVFVIDSHDRERLDELNYDVIKPAINAEELMNAVFLFLANKTDLPDTMSTEEISEKLGLKFLKHPWGILPVSAASGEGLQASMDWLAVRLGSVQVKARNFTTVRPKPKVLNQCRTASSLSSASSTATSKTDNSKATSRVSVPAKPVIFVNSKLYTDTMTTPTVSSGSVDNTSLRSVSTPGSYFSPYIPKRSPGSVMNTFSSYSIAQSMRDDISRRKFSAISRSDIRKMSCASMIEGTDNRKMSTGSLFDSPIHRKMSSVSLLDSPHRRKMSSFVIDAPPYRKFSSASLTDAAYARKMSASSLNDGTITELIYSRKLSAGNSQMTGNSRKFSAASLGDSQDEHDRPKMSYLMAAPVAVATPPISKRRSVDMSSAGFGKFTPMMADYIQDRKDSDTSCDSLNLTTSSDNEQPTGFRPPSQPTSSKYPPNSIEAMKEQHYSEILSLLPESYTNMYYRDYFSEPVERFFNSDRDQNSLSALDDDEDDEDDDDDGFNDRKLNARDLKQQNYNSEHNHQKKQFHKPTRQASNDSDSSSVSCSRKGRLAHLHLLCTPSKRSHSQNRSRNTQKNQSPVTTASPTSKGTNHSRAYTAFRCLFFRSNKSKTQKETNSICSEHSIATKANDKKETRVSFDLDNQNIRVEIIEVGDRKGESNDVKKVQTTTQAETYY